MKEKEGERGTEKSFHGYRQASPTMLTTRALIIDSTRPGCASTKDKSGGRHMIEVISVVHGQSFCGLSSWHVEADSAKLWAMMFRVRVSS
jgi:hypothetical protein